MRSLHTPQQETNSAYNPGVTYRGGELMAQGLSQAGDAISAGLQHYAQRQQLRAELIAQMSDRPKAPEALAPLPALAGPNWSTGGDETASGLAYPGGVGGNAPNSGKSIGDQGAGGGGSEVPEAVKSAAKVTQALRTIGEHGYGYSKDQLSTMGLGELQGLAKRHFEDERRQQIDLARQDRLAQFAQLTRHQDEMQRLQGLSTGATVRNLNSEIAQRDRIASQDEAVGQGLAAYSRGGTNVNPDISYSDWANRVGGLGNAPPPEGSTPFTHQQRMDRAMQTLGLGGRGAVQLQDELRKLGPRQETPMDAAHINLYNAQAAKFLSDAGAQAADNKPKEFTDSKGEGWLYNPRTGNYVRRDVTGFEQATDLDGNPVAGLGTLGGKVVKIPVAKSSELTPAALLKSYEGELKELNNPMSWMGTQPEERAAHRAILTARIEQLRAGKPAPAPSGAAGVAKPTSQAEFDALPSGAEFVNPATGQKMRKK